MKLFVSIKAGVDDKELISSLACSRKSFVDGFDYFVRLNTIFPHGTQDLEKEISEVLVYGEYELDKIRLESIKIYDITAKDMAFQLKEAREKTALDIALNKSMAEHMGVEANKAGIKLYESGLTREQYIGKYGITAPPVVHKSFLHLVTVE